MAGRAKQPQRYSLDDLLTVTQVAEKLGVSIKTIYDWTHKRRIPYTKLGRRVYFSRTAIEDKLTENRKEPL